jgi:hypothetical protein
MMPARKTVTCSRLRPFSFATGPSGSADGSITRNCLRAAGDNKQTKVYFWRIFNEQLAYFCLLLESTYNFRH